MNKELMFRVNKKIYFNNFVVKSLNKKTNGGKAKWQI